MPDLRSFLNKGHRRASRSPSRLTSVAQLSPPVRVAVMVALFAGGAVNAEPAAAQPVATSKSDPFEPFAAETALRFGIPASWIKAIMQVESQGVVRVVSPKGVMGLMQIMPHTWTGLQSRYGLGANPFDPHDNILAGAAYLRKLHDRFGAAGFLAAYNAGPRHSEDHLATSRPLPLETQGYVAGLTPLLRDDGSAPGNIITTIIRSWTSSLLFTMRANDSSSAGSALFVVGNKRQPIARPATDWAGFAPQSEGLFAPLSAREPGYEPPSVSSGSGGPSDRFECGRRGAEATNPRTAR